MLTNCEIFEKFSTIPYKVFNLKYRKYWRYKDDLEQEGFLKLWYCTGKLDQSLSEGEQAKYLYRAVDNQMHKFIFRKQYKHECNQVEFDSCPTDGDFGSHGDPCRFHSDIHIDYTVIAALERALLGSPLAFKRYVLSKKITEIADEENLTVSKVNYQLNLFKSRIKAIVFRDGERFDIEPEVYSACHALRSAE